MNRETPTCLYFSRQDSLCIWDEKEVLDALEGELIRINESYKRHEPSEAHQLGHLDIYCTHEDIARKIRAMYEAIRGTV